MKTISFKIIMLVLITMFIGACLKDKDFDSGKIQAVDNHGNQQNMIGFNLSASSTLNFVPYAVVPSHDLETFNLLPIVLSAKDVAAHDIHVKIAPDTAYLHEVNSELFDEFNDDGTLKKEHPELYYVFPSDTITTEVSPAYELVSDVVTIPAGSSVGYIQIKTASYDYFGSHGWAFAYRIVSVEEGNAISGNSYRGVAALIPENKYDGKYDMEIEMNGWSAYGISEYLPGDFGTIDFVTSGLYTNTIAAQYGFTAGNAGKTQFGATNPQFTFDDSDNLTAVTNLAPDDGRGRKFEIINAPDPHNSNDGHKTNFYDPASKTIYAYYLFKQNGRPNDTVRCTFSYNGPR